jgi:uncharacterized delta-60 repeat protein
MRLQYSILIMIVSLLNSSLLLAILPVSSATNPAILMKTWGGSRDDNAKAVAMDSHGNFYVAGYSSSFGPGNTTSQIVVFLLKYSPIGNLLWQRIWFGPSVNNAGNGDEARAIAVDSSDNIYVVGDTSSFRTFRGGYGYDILLLKFNSSGSLLWQETWGNSTAFGRGFGVGLDSQGYVYVTGFTATYSVQTKDVLLLKFDPAGNLLWQKTLGSGGDDFGYGVAVDSSGGVYVTGSNALANGDTGVLLVKFSSTGGLVWAKTWSGESLDSGYSVAVDASGNVYVTGYRGINFEGDYEVVLLKFDSSGSSLWERTWGGYNDASANSLAVDPSGYVYVTGWWSYNSASGGLDVLLLKYDSSGNVVFQGLWGGYSHTHGDDDAQGIVVNSSGYVAVTGYVGHAPPYSPVSTLNGTCTDVTDCSFPVGNPTLSTSTPTYTTTITNGTVALPSGNETYYPNSGNDAFLWIFSPLPNRIVSNSPGLFSPLFIGGALGVIVVAVGGILYWRRSSRRAKGADTSLLRDTSK